MAYDNQHGNTRSFGQPGNRGPVQQGDRFNRPYTPPAPAKPIEPRPIPADYVDEAERVISRIKTMGNGRIRVTTSKLRVFLAMVSDIYNKESLRTEETLSSDSQLKLMRLRVRIVYDAGRENDVRDFVENAKLLAYIKGIGSSRTEMIRFAHYMEALVAYHRFMGGKEN